MPRITIVMSEGRTIDQKRKLVKAVTEAIVEVLGPSQKEATTIAIHEIPITNFAVGGVLIPDRK